MMFARLPYLGCLLAVAALAPKCACAQTCQGGITASCSTPPSYTCGLPGTSISMTMVCNPIKCTAAGQSPTSPAITATGTGTCGCTNCGVLYVPDCPPSFSQQTSIRGANESETFSLTVTNHSFLLVCITSSTVTYTSTCNSNCNCH